MMVRSIFVNLPVADLERSITFFTELELVRKSVAAGGRTYNEPQDHGFMYGHGFQDPDGHVWEVFHMDMPA